ncbi:MAG: adenylosuccinate synthase [Planctomycetota bacterium]|jgi:adenylosuccinate synthase
MPTTCVVGILWGDEGKGKVIDYLAAETDFVVRFGGGHNAGHTLVLPPEIAGEGKLVLHLVPSGIVHPHTVNVIGNGVVVDPIHLCSEIAKLRKRGIVIELGRNMLVSERAHVILEAHQRQDQLAESGRNSKIGTTGRGIGPAYSDRCGRIGLRVGDLIRPDTLRQALTALAVQKNALFEPAGMEPLDVDAMFEQLVAAGEELRPAIVDAGLVLRQARIEGKRILLEGAQGCLLDLEHGTYPFVTSSHATTGGAFSGTGMPPHEMHTVGIVKSYATRVGEGPFPTELFDETAEKLRAAGKEYGSTTGRPRRIGWFDAVAVRYSAGISGAHELVLTSLDVLQGFPLKLAVDYKLADGTLSKDLPAFDLEKVEPQFLEMPGFDENICDVRDFDALPQNAKNYVAAIEEQTGMRVGTISVGPGRDQLIKR